MLVTTGKDPGCFQLPNTKAQAALGAAVEQAERQCKHPILRDAQVTIRQVSGCNPSLVKATFLCVGESE